MKMSPPPLIYWSPVTVIWFLRWIRRLCIQITVLSLSLVILLGFTWDFKMEETTHDSSSSSRKSEEKCPPAGGIKMKIGGFKTGHCYHKPSDAAIQQEPSRVSSGVWLPRLSQDDFDIHKEPPPVVGRTNIYELLQLETVCILVRYSYTLTFSAHSNKLVT